MTGTENSVHIPDSQIYGGSRESCPRCKCSCIKEVLLKQGAFKTLDIDNVCTMTDTVLFVFGIISVDFLNHLEQ